MAKYEWKGEVLSISLDDTEGAATDVTMDMSKLTPQVIAAAAKFGMQTALRNSTAGKMDDLAEARKALVAKATVFNGGVWAEAKTGAAKPALSDNEKADCIGAVIVEAKQAKGDKRTALEILKAFNELPEDQRKAIVVSLQKLIDKRMAAKLKQKKEMAKASVLATDF